MHPQLIRNRRAFLPQKPRLSQPFQKLTVSGWTLASAIDSHALAYSGPVLVPVDADFAVPNVTEKRPRGWSRLYLAAANGQAAVVRRLIGAGANVNDIGSPNNFTALMGAARRGHHAVAQLRIGAGADVNYAQSERWTALLLAAGAGHESTVSLLLDHGAEVDQLFHDGWTALMRALDIPQGSQ
jgi:hypothetical protein